MNNKTKHSDLKTKADQTKASGLLKILILNFTFLIPLSVYAASYTDNGNGTVTDATTSLIWQKCSMGQNNDATCSGSATTATWVNAIAYCENLTLGGHSNWRLPNVNELKSIVATTRISPAIDVSAFPGTQSSAYWSSTNYAGGADGAWFVHFPNGYTNASGKAGAYYVRCVSAGP